MSRILRTTAAGLGLALVVPTVLLATPASAATGPMNYDCTITSPITKTTPATVEYDTTAPAKVYLGDPAIVADLDGRGSIDAETVNLAISFMSATHVAGNSDIAMQWNGGTVQVKTAGEKKALVKDKPTDLSGYYPGAVTLPMPTSPGRYDLVFPKTYKSVNKLYKSNGSVASEPVANCVWKSGATVVDTVEVWAKATTTLSTPGPVGVGATSSVTATIVSPGSTPAGEVEFTINGEKIRSRVVNNKATVEFPASAQGTYPVQATYLPSAPMVEAQTTAPLDVVVERAATTTLLSVTPNRVVAGEPATAKVKVVPTAGASAGVPDGTVEIDVLGSTLTGALVNGTAEIVLTELRDLPVGPLSLTANYLPGTTGAFGQAFTASSSSALDLDVKVPATATSTAITLDRTTAVSDETVKVTAKVTAAQGTAEGTVKIMVGARSVPGTLVNGEVEVVLPRLAVGAYDVSAAFTPSDPEAFAASVSNTVGLEITPAANTTSTRTTLSLTPTSVRAGNAATARVTINTDAGLPDGLVRVAVGDLRLGDVSVVSGVATVALPKLTPGTYPVEAEFIPDLPTFADSVSPVATLTVTAAPSNTSVSVVDARVSAGNDVVTKVSVAGSDVNGPAQGQVTAAVGDVTATGTLVNGKADLTLSGLPVGTHEIAVSYQPATGSWLAGSNTTASATVLAPAVQTEIELSLEQAQVTVGTPGRAIAVVAGGARTPQGRVEFRANGQTWQVPLDSSGKATKSLSGLAAGTYEVEASFIPNDPKLATPSSATSVTLTVEAGQTAESKKTTTVLTVPSRATFGSRYPVRASVSGASGVSGSVVFTSGWSKVSVPVVNGAASATVPATAVGQQSVSAEFVPAGTSVSGSFATATTQVVKRASATTVQAKVLKKTRKLRLTAKVSPVDQTCGGTVTFQVRRGAKRVGKAVRVTLPCSGSVRRTVKLPKAKGAYTVTALYSGTTNTNGSQRVRKFKR